MMDFLEFMAPAQGGLVKLGLTVMCTGLIGLERELTGKPAGLRTNILIGLGACFMMILSVQVAAAAKLGDPGRIAAQVVTGIGFLGAGTIIQSRGAVYGLTTAATIWVVAGVGLLIGGGYYALGLLATAVVLFTLLALGRLEQRIHTFGYRDIVFVVTAKNEDGVVEEVLAAVEQRGGSMQNRHLDKRDGSVRITFTHRHTSRGQSQLLADLAGHEHVLEVREE